MRELWVMGPFSLQTNLGNPLSYEALREYGLRGS
jgi:hypothetical protein